MSEIESSVIIPVFNQWELTRACLKALAATTAGKAVEVIVVDNASSDATPEACPFLGERLFGKFFRYHRCPENRNFGPASNLGAQLAAGEFLIFLNNDTVPLPGWYQPLIDDFSQWPDLAATGPLLLYPESEPFGFTVQHLGVFVSPLMKVGHLYEGISAECPLAKKRRFFQIITAACMVMRRALFMETGMFDENYVNGFEDADLCARLIGKGYRLTVNPEARVVHHTSQTSGRHQHEDENFEYFASRRLPSLVPDWHLHLKNDGMALRLGEWQTLQGTLPPEECGHLDKIAAKSSREELTELLARHPFWENGWRLLAADNEKKPGQMDMELARFKLYPSADGAMNLYKAACAAHDQKAVTSALGLLTSFCKPFEEYVSSAETVSKWCPKMGLDELADQYVAWLAGAERFKTQVYQPFLEDFWKIASQFTLHPHANWAYTLWRRVVDLPRREAESALAVPSSGDIGFSVLMPVYNPEVEHLVAALESLMAQDCPHWELCAADDASTNPVIKVILDRYARKDSRIRVVWREKNGHIAAATNTALEMARYPYAVLMDQDDLLTPDALRVVAETIAKHPDGLLFYSDEDKIHDEGYVFYPYFKNGKWDWELLHGQNYVSHLGVYRTDRMRQIGGFREGFRGSQDFDMLLRYIAGADARNLVHIPRVLYHWRAHAGSTALDVGVKSEAVDSARRAVQERLDAFSPGAESCILPNSQFLRVKFPLPEKRPLVSLLCDVGDNLSLLKECLPALTAKTAYTKYEILLLCNEAVGEGHTAAARRFAALHKNVRLLPYAAELSPPERLMGGVELACGQVLGFLAGGIAPLTEDWLEEMVSCLWRDGVGAVGGKVLRRNGNMLHGGYLTDASGKLGAVLQGLSCNEPGWFNWAKSARTVDALDDMCLFTRAETLADLGGLDASLPHASLPDYCLRLGEKRQRTVWWPFAEFMQLDDRKARTCGAWPVDRDFTARWADRLAPFNENLVAAGAGWTLYASGPLCKTYNSIASASILVSPPQKKEDKLIASLTALIDESFYYDLYPDVKEAGISAFDHYMSYGYAEGRLPNIDFDVVFYQKQYPELKETNENPLLHYVTKGKEQGALYKKPEIVLRNYSREYEALRDAALPNDSVRLLAWYLPQFHPIGENDAAWGLGFTEWSNVAAARPRFAGHHQPCLPGALGFYDLRRKETMQEQMFLAKHAGIYGFILHHYWFAGQAVLREPLEHLRQNSDLDFPFCLSWANEAWTRRWDGGSQDVIIAQQYSPKDDLDFIHDISWALRDRRYIRFQGKPMLGIYRPGLLPDVASTLQRWREYCRLEGIGEIFIFSVLSFENTPSQSKRYGFDGTIEFPPFGITTSNMASSITKLDYSGAVYSYTEARDFFINATRHPSGPVKFRGVMPGWDNSARSETGKFFVDATPEGYSSWLEKTSGLAEQDTYGGEKYIAINAWNEWAEGAYLEPDARQGFAVLNATAQAITCDVGLPHVLFVCDIENRDQADWLESLLQANRAAPVCRPVVFVPKPVHSTGTFRGVAPLLSCLNNAEVSTIKQLFAASGYLNFALSVVATQILTHDQASGIMMISSGVIYCDASIPPVVLESEEGKVWRAENIHAPLLQWQLYNPISCQKESCTHMLRQAQIKLRDAVEISVIVLSPDVNENFLSTMRRTQAQSPYPMEVLVPAGAEKICHKQLAAARGISEEAGTTYLAAAFSQARGEYIWLVVPSEGVDPLTPRLLRPPFVDTSVACTLKSSLLEQHGVSGLCENHTIKINGADFLQYFNKKSGKIFSQYAEVLFRKSALMKACWSQETGGDAFFESVLSLACADGDVAVVPCRIQTTVKS